MADLPDEILTEVFSYLPTKSIGRLRRLSRSWCVVLSSASFRDLHRRRANRPGQLKVFFSPNDKTLEEDGSSYFYAWQPGGAPPTKLMLHKFHQPAPLTRPLHGLVLISCPGTGYHVCNPSTGEALALPDTALSAKMTNCLQFYYQHVTYGLGYCLVNDEYKAVRLFSSNYKGGKTCCEVFVLGGAPYWRPTARRPPTCIVDEKNPGVFLDGRLHFLCHGRRIISFDLSSETFGAVESPSNMRHASVRMTELDGCLCVYHKNIGHRHGSCHIWVLRNYGKRQQRWEQLCQIDPMAWTKSVRKQLRSSWIAPLGMYDGNNRQRRILFDTGTCKVFALDIPNGDEPEILFSPDKDDTIAGSFHDYNKPRLGLFEESLTPME